MERKKEVIEGAKGKKYGYQVEASQGFDLPYFL